MPVHDMDKRFERILIDRLERCGRLDRTHAEQHGFLIVELDPAVVTGRILPT